jgi:DNA primase
LAFARSSDDRDRVKGATDIVRLIGEHVTLRAKGREYACLCPFHDDHNPSMYVVPGKQIYHCFVCGAGGDAFDFVMGYHRMEFREALEYLADRAAIKLTESPAPGGAGPSASGPSRTDILGACGIAQSFFRAVLRRDDLGGPAREALRARGISDEMIERFGLGASPDRLDGLASVVQGKNLPVRAFAEAGLLYADRGPPADVFRGRIMFPIRDQIGRAIAFGARVIGDGDGPKYLNSRETRIFHKSDALYGLSEASEAIRATRIAIICEGYTDVIACHQAGVCNVVGTLGTALTTGHARVLRRLCDRAVLLFDGDDAGLRAADRAIEVFFREPIDVSVATLSTVSTAKDPDELLRQEGGAELLARAVETAPDLLTFRFARLRQRLAGATPTTTAEAVQQEMDRLVELGLRDVSPILRQMVVRQIARIAGVDEALILKAIPAGRKPRPRDDDPDARPAPIGARERALGLLMAHPGLAAAAREDDAALLAPDQMAGDGARAIALSIAHFLADGHHPALDAVMGDLEGAARAEAVRYCRAIETSASADPAIAAEEFRQILLRLAHDSAPAPEAGAPLAARLEAVRQRRADFGPDRRRAPRVHTAPER